MAVALRFDEKFAFSRFRARQCDFKAHFGDWLFSNLSLISERIVLVYFSVKLVKIHRAITRQTRFDGKLLDELDLTGILANCVFLMFIKSFCIVRRHVGSLC